MNPNKRDEKTEFVSVNNDKVDSYLDRYTKAVLFLFSSVEEKEILIREEALLIAGKK